MGGTIPDPWKREMINVFDFGKRAARHKRRAARQKALQERRRIDQELDVVFNDMRAEIRTLQSEVTWKPFEAKTKRLHMVRSVSALTSLWVVRPFKAPSQRSLMAGQPFQPVDLKPAAEYSEPA